MALNFANNNSLSAISSLPASISGGGMTLISTQTASSSSTISFTSGIDSTYDEYVFKFINIHPATSNATVTFQGSINGGSSYGITATTTFFQARLNEDGSGEEFIFNGGQSQSSNFISISNAIKNDNDCSSSGTIRLFGLSSNTFVKHFIAESNSIYTHPSLGDFLLNVYSAGYLNDGSNDVNAIQFKMSSGNMDSGTIKMYGIS